MAKVFVGMSGGVDSSVTAALMVEQGHDVTGIYMKNWTQDMPGVHCAWADDVADAKRVAVELGINFEVFDFEMQYKQKVVDVMVAEYQAGRTPNPDVMCNQEIKFKLFLEAALENGADMIATGHYAQTGSEESPLAADSLYKAVDDNKDQTYFLYRVSAKALEKTIFPLGGMTKQQVREYAEQKGLWTANKKESMGICFVGQVGIKEFLQQYVDLVPGDIVEQETGKTLGQHESALLYTIGQRHGLNLGGGLPYYVTKKDIENNIVYVSQDISNTSIWRDSFSLSDVHWINGLPHSDEGLQVRLRHRGQLVNISSIDISDDSVNIKLDHTERAIAAGQSAVIYRGHQVLGGGIIG